MIIYSEKATKSNKLYWVIFSYLCGLLRIYELYPLTILQDMFEFFLLQHRMQQVCLENVFCEIY